MANILYNLKEYSHAAAPYTEAIRLIDKEKKLIEVAEYYNKRGESHSHLSEFEEAKTDYKEAIKLDPRNYTYHTNLVNTLYKLKEYEEAITYCTTEIKHIDEEKNSKQSAALYYAIRAGAKAKFGFCEDVMNDCNTAISLNGTISIAHRVKGDANRALGRYRDAIMSYDAAIRCKGDNSRAYYGRGIINEIFNKNFNKAIEDYKTAIEINKQTKSFTDDERKEANDALARATQINTCADN